MENTENSIAENTAEQTENTPKKFEKIKEKVKDKVNGQVQSLSKLSKADKRRLVKKGMIASLALTAVSGFVHTKHSKAIHLVSALSFLGLSAVHSLQNSPKKK